MKVATETQSHQDLWSKPMDIVIPKGMIGFDEVTEYEVLVNMEELPFMWVRGKDHHDLAFVVVEPSAVLNDYQVEISDDDIKFLEIESEDDVMILNVVTIKDGESIESATINLIGPVIVNRKTFRGKQVVVSNYLKFSAHHPILSESVEG